MWHSGQEIKLIRPFCEKWEPNPSAGIFSFVYFSDLLYKMKIEIDVGKSDQIKILKYSPVSTNITLAFKHYCLSKSEKFKLTTIINTP